MVWTFLCSKIALLLHKLLFGDMKLSDLERRNRKLSAHDCTDHIKTLFSSHNYHETRNINTSCRHVAHTRPQLYHTARTSPQST